MAETIRHLAWFAVASTAVAYATFLVLGSVVEAQAESANSPVLVRDELTNVEQFLSGMVNVPASCDQLGVQVMQIDSSTYRLAFTTWRDPSVSCSDDPMPRYFRVRMQNASTTLRFVATMDGKDMPIAALKVGPASPDSL